MRIDLSGKIAVVTGATGELGRTLVRAFARCGANVAIHYLQNEKKAKELCAEVAALGARAMTIQADVTDFDSVMAMRAGICEALGAPDILVINAVVPYQWATVLEQSVADYEQQFRCGTMQAVLLAKALIPAMVAKRYGRVIAISSECALQNVPRQSAYVSGKRGMDGVLRVLAREVGEYRITVNQVAPGPIITENRPKESREALARNVPMKRCAEAQEVANVVAFLACDLASFVTGAFIPVCGGTVMPAI